MWTNEEVGAGLQVGCIAQAVGLRLQEGEDKSCTALATKGDKAIPMMNKRKSNENIGRKC